MLYMEKILTYKHGQFFSFPLCHMCRNILEMEMVDLLVGKSSPWLIL